ncbi:hypothetical protein C8R46DRAFT_1115879 [Mycena filopes]|nr:hypothetical protein C8R46DRAFT_1115879 [Mycena filopes]
MTSEPETIAVYEIDQNLDPPYLWTMVATATRTEEHSDNLPVALPRTLEAKTSTGRTFYTFYHGIHQLKFKYDADLETYRYGEMCGDMKIERQIKWTPIDDPVGLQWLSYELDANGKVIEPPLAKLSASIWNSEGPPKVTLFAGRAASIEKLVALIIMTAAHVPLVAPGILAVYRMPTGGALTSVVATRIDLETAKSSARNLPDMLRVERGEGKVFHYEYMNGETTSNLKHFELEGEEKEGHEEVQFSDGGRQFSLVLEQINERIGLQASLREMKGDLRGPLLLGFSIADRPQATASVNIFPAILHLGQMKGESAKATPTSRAVRLIAGTLARMKLSKPEKPDKPDEPFPTLVDTGGMHTPSRSLVDVPGGPGMTVGVQVFTMGDMPDVAFAADLFALPVWVGEVKTMDVSFVLEQ